MQAVTAATSSWALAFFIHKPVPSLHASGKRHIEICRNFRSQNPNTGFFVDRRIALWQSEYLVLMLCWIAYQRWEMLRYRCNSREIYPVLLLTEGL